ncbi:hypothetical protein FBU30_009581 [Linnemannia zychae]|nr:hypothetical protein FBU30_009581 [Linnemannia zychae]
MKFVAVALALAAVASAQIQINDPTQGTVWKVGAPSYVRWSGNCASMGASGKNVTVDVVKGDANSLQYVTSIGTIDCTSATETSTMLTVPNQINGDPFVSGTYSLRVNAVPVQYSTTFTINNPTTPTTPPTTSAPSTPSPSSNKPGSGANTLVAGSAIAVAAVAVLQLVL